MSRSRSRIIALSLIRDILVFKQVLLALIIHCFISGRWLFLEFIDDPVCWNMFTLSKVFLPAVGTKFSGHLPLS